MDIQEYVQAFDEAERDFAASVEAYGVPFERVESAPREARERVAASCGCHCENGAFSLWRTWISPACAACRTGEETATFFVDLRCTRHCYFCFNPNQDRYDYFLSHARDIVAELEQARAAGARFRFLAITGGEPLLHKDRVAAFLRRAAELYPCLLYTSGQRLSRALSGCDGCRARSATQRRLSLIHIWMSAARARRPMNVMAGCAVDARCAVPFMVSTFL